MYKEQTQQLARIVPTVAGQRATTDMISAVRTLYLDFRIRATVTLAGGPQTAMRNAGSLFALVDQIGITENGRDRALMDGRMLRVLAEMVAARTLSATRISNYANGAYVLEESARLPFAWPLGAQPVDTAFMQRVPEAKCQAFAQFSAIAAGLTTTLGNAGTATISALSLDVIQGYDDSLGVKPHFIPSYRTVATPIAGTVTDFPVLLATERYLRAAIIAQRATVVGEVDDIITNMALRSDNRDLIGPRLADFENLTCAAEQEFGGDFRNHGFDASATATQPRTNAYLPINFQRQGRLGNILNPLRDINLRLEVDAAVSVTAGAGTSSITTLLCELERVRGLTSEAPPFQA